MADTPLDPVAKYLQTAIEAVQKATELVSDPQCSSKRLEALHKLQRAQELWTEGRALTLQAETLLRSIDEEAISSLNSTMAAVTPRIQISELGLSARAENALSNRKVKWVDELLLISERELLSIPGLGKGGRREIIEVLTARGIIPPWHAGQ